MNVRPLTAAAVPQQFESTEYDVSLQGVGKRYGDAWAIRDLHLDIRGGEFISLLGPSGCGKTTTLRLIAGFEKLDEGEITVGGASLGHVPPHRRPTNTVFQSYALFPHLSVADNVAYGLRQRRVPKADIRAEVSRTLELVRMRSFADRSPHQLSGGQQQRVALARAIVNKPSVLLLDEPMSALDRKLREEMQLELKLLQQELGITFVFVTHDQDEALTMSDRIAVMNGGRIEQFTAPASIYDEPNSLFVATFVGQQNLFEGVVTALDGSSVSVTTPHGTLQSSRESAIRVAAPGINVTCAVRPEKVTVRSASDPAAPPTPNTVGGVLQNVSRVSSRLQLAIVLSEGTRLLASAAPEDAIPQVGSRVSVSWAHDAVYVYSAADSDPTSASSTKETRNV